MSPKKKPSAPIYNRVRVLRVERDMSRAQLAEAIDVNPQTIGVHLSAATTPPAWT